MPAEAIVIGALGTNTLKLAGENTLGAHPYLTVPAHTRHAREVLGSRAFLAPEHKVVLIHDDDQARTIGRPAVQNPYLGLRNYTNNLMRHGFTDVDVDGSGSDRTWSLSLRSYTAAACGFSSLMANFHLKCPLDVQLDI